jgi:CO/xanthine dehydrogenase Mo-binding subunit
MVDLPIPQERRVGDPEASTTPVAAALGNAVFDATGLRLREGRFTVVRVKASFTAAI